MGTDSLEIDAQLPDIATENGAACPKLSSPRKSLRMMYLLQGTFRA
jgi:hypothetical protein